MLAATSFLLAKAACAKAVAPPALAPDAAKLSKVFAKAISAFSVKNTVAKLITKPIIIPIVLRSSCTLVSSLIFTAIFDVFKV